MALCVIVVMATAFSDIKPSQAFANASDRLSLTWPGVPTSHTITLKLTKNLPASGKIVVLPQGGFFVEPFFDYSNVDISVAPDINAVFNDRDIDVIADMDSDGVTAQASTTDGSIEIKLNSSVGIEAGNFIKIELGRIADFGASGTSQIVNPVTTGSYRVEARSYDENDAYLERAVTMVAIIEPVTMSNYVVKTRTNGSPNGVLTYGTVQTILSLMTNYRAICRWSRTASTSWTMMTDTFDNTNSFYHSSIITGITSGTYNYYVRCRDEFLVLDDTDYLISFVISGFEGQGGDQDTEGSPGSGGSTGPGTGKGTGGGSGSATNGGVGDFQPFPVLPTNPIVSFKGLAYPSAKVSLLKDGVEFQNIVAGVNGSFEMGIKELPQGVYTFSLATEDKAGRKPPALSYTFYVKDGTQTNLHDIYFSPTIDVPKPSFKIGESLDVLGQSVASSDIDLWLYPKVVGGAKDSAIIKYQGKSALNGDWNFIIDTNKLANGPYQLKARSTTKDAGTSDFSKLVDLMVGGELPKQTCGGADLNGDGKVNITDFSILLYWWNQNNDCADQNDDGTVNLVDFSIMMYNWTG